MGKIRLFIVWSLVVVLGISLIPPVTAENVSVTVDNATVYLGETIRFSGSNTISDDVYLFMTGPNLPTAGGNLFDPRTPVVTGDTATFVIVDVGDDDTWALNWSTKYTDIYPGTYTVYAAAAPESVDDLNETGYATQIIDFIADTRMYPVTPDNTAAEDTSTDGPPMVAIPGDVIDIGTNAEGGITYFGETITLSGSNSATDTVYLFMTGPNLPPAGGILNDPRTPVVNGDPETFARAKVLEDNNWSYVWQTANLNIDPGTYSVYAVTGPNSSDFLENGAYATVPVTFRKPFLTVDIPQSAVPAGGLFHITGTARGGTPYGIMIWILGRNFYFVDNVPVADDYTFDYEVSAGMTTGMGEGRYFVVVQHPMTNNQFDVFPGTGANEGYVMGTFPMMPSRLFRAEGVASLTGYGNSSVPAAMEALIHDLNDPNIDDRYARFPLVIGEPLPPVLTGDYLSATVQPSIVFRGGNLSIQGTARGKPSYLMIWIAGEDRIMRDTVPVNPDSGYKYEVPVSDLPDGEYTVIVQHPMYNTMFDVFPGTGMNADYIMGTYPVNPSRLFRIGGQGSLPGLAAIEALAYDLDNPDIDDRYIRLNFTVESDLIPLMDEGALSVNVTPPVVTRGQHAIISGKAESDTDFVLIWILGKNFFMIDAENPRPDSTFEYELSDDVTDNLAAGPYTVIVQDPMNNGQLDVFPGVGMNGGYVMGTYPVNPSRLFKIEGASSLFTSAATDALVWDLNNPNIDDRYGQAAFEVTGASPPPTITSLEPDSVPAGSDGFSLVVEGTNFMNGARVVWDGRNRTTSFVTPAELIAEIQKEDVASPGNIAVKVVNPDANESQEVTFSVLPGCSFPVTLAAGWNLFSIPVSLDPGNSTLPGMFPPSEQQNISVVLGWDGTQWYIPSVSETIRPLSAYYIRVVDNSTATALLIPSKDLSAPPSRQVVSGVNLIGPAPAYDPDVQAFETMPLDQSLISIDKVGSSTGYVIVISPGLNQPGWAYARGGQIRDTLPFKGYWVVMADGPGTLYGFSTTPIVTIRNW